GRPATRPRPAPPHRPSRPPRSPILYSSSCATPGAGVTGPQKESPRNTRKTRKESTDSLSSFFVLFVCFVVASYSSLNVDFSNLYSAILALMLRRDRPQILAQRPTLPRAFFSAFWMYCRSTLSVTVRNRSGSGVSRSMRNGDFDDGGASSSGGRFSTWMALS